ncbi:MAG: hypothetical protein K9G58_13655 [Bacteroidales bacterium]|nr:hypothetical protein [Bacteroidales bacterium]MCF8399215.1 hypothetical protein [Bacteroidales bacterium]
MRFFKYCILIISLFPFTANISQSTANWIEFQTIPAHGARVHAITYANGMLAINFNNKEVMIYRIVNDQWEMEKSFEIKWVWDEFGTMRFFDGYLYVSIDGHKYYRIDIEREKIKKTNTYKAGFYIISRKDFEYFGKDWIFELDENGDIMVYYNEPIFPPGYIDSLKARY